MCHSLQIHSSSMLVLNVLLNIPTKALCNPYLRSKTDSRVRNRR
jgi:hypothetical protein